MWKHLYLPSSAVPVGGLQRPLPLSRRHFLGLLATAPAIPSLSAAFAADRADDSNLDLAFDLSADGSNLRVLRVDHETREPAPGLKTLDMSIDMFGQKSWFDIARPGSDAKKRTLYIRNISYGGLVDRKIELFFENVAGWKLRILTDVWLDSDGKSLEYETEHPVFLDDFIKEKAEATETLWASRVNKTFLRMFAGRIDAGNGKDDIAIGLTGKFQWHVSTIGKPLGAFAGQIAVTDFSLGWHEKAAKAADGTTAGPHFGGIGAIVSVANLRAGNSAGLNFRLIRPDPPAGGKWQFEIRRGPSALLPGAFQTVSRIVVGTTTAEFVEKGAQVAGPLELQQLVATETSIVFPGKDEIVRTVISAAGAVDMEKGDADGESVAVPRKTEITTAIGRIRATGAYKDHEEGVAKADDVPAGGSPSASDAVTTTGDDFSKVILAASGDRAGAPGQTVWIVADRGAKAGDQQRLRRAAVDLHLLEADTALPDVSHSRLRFERAELRLSFADGLPLAGPIAESPTADSSSFIWLGTPTAGARQATLDLSRASLMAARDYDQMRLRFRFSDMILAFTPQPIILPAREDCGVVVAPRQERADMSEEERGALPGPVRVDTRPVLVVEFDPQHVMEEAIFRPELPPLPDFGLDKDQQAAAAQLKPELVQRKFIQDEKKKNEQAAGSDLGNPFANFCGKFATATETAELSEEQRVYIGPDGLQPDAFEAARKLQMQSIDGTIRAAIDQLIDVQAAAQITAIQAAESGPDNQPKPLPTDYDLRLELERKLESSLPLYSLFRGFYRDLFTGNSKMKPADPATDSAMEAEYFHPINLAGLSTEQLTMAGRRDKDARSKFTTFASGRDGIPDIVEARLSGPTRLAFRVNCRPGLGDGHDANGMPAFPPASATKPGAAGIAFGAIPFTFASLTDWSHHEPAVTRRAEKLFREAPSGMMPPLGEQAADLDDHRMLGHQGLSAGEDVTGAQRMSEIRASLAQNPTTLETAIEIPSRLVLSTAQDAVWQATRRFPIPHGNPEFASPPAVLEYGETPTQLKARALSHSSDLWTARLLVDDILPSLRVVGTPDFRPMALQPSPGDGKSPLPGHFAPPRGAYAPWFLGAEQSNSGVNSPLATHVAAFPEDQGKWGDHDDQAFCKEEKSFPAPRKLRLVDWLCRRLGIRSETEADIKFFRTSLDAYDRHELLLLGSAYGLPVTGKRKAIGENVEEGGALIDGSGQFEPGKEFALLDGRNDEAIYRPVPLNATELTLSTLGGSFTHDTHFNPPATALDTNGRPFFTGMSIERWQHQIVLGRDIRAEVVYKGYLFPLGHRASLVKLTERIFLLTEKQGYKALLRQHMFLRIGKPDKKYPAVGQPNAGRQWCASDVLMLTRRTPDIVDPTTPVSATGQLAEEPNGKLNLGDAPGLAFWPKIDLTDQGRIAFQFALDGKPTSMPLLFLDNVAATTPASVKKVADYYNTLTSDLRSMPLRGQKLRFAEEMESGDTTFATDSVLVQAQGRRSPGGAQWGGDNSLYATTGVLEGAEQPPFYPMVEKAFIHIEQVERFTGSGANPTVVRYDGHFLEEGFQGEKKASDGAGQVADNGNPLEVFLDLVTPVPLNMGGSGDRSGGIARPNSMIYALSRSKGPLGADKPAYAAKPDPLKTIETEIVSLAEYFRKAKPPTAAPPTGAMAVANSDNEANDAEQLKVFERFFSSDAKLLGIIKLRDLMKWFNLSGANLPLLKETMEFGSALQDAAADALSLVRINVLLPLKAVVKTIAEQWNALDERLAKEQAKVAEGAEKQEKISIKRYFPEIDEGLTGLSQMLDAALAENDLLKLPKKLSAIYEAGKRFARLLATLAANAPERLQEAVRDQLLNGISNILGAKAALETTLDKLEAIGKGDAKAAIADVVAQMIGTIEYLDDFIPLPVPVPDLVAAVRVAGGTASEVAAAEGQAREAAKLLRAAVATAKQELNDAVKQTTIELCTGVITLEMAVAKLAKTLIGAAKGAIEDALDYIEQNTDAPYKSRLLGAVQAYRTRLEEVEKRIDATPSQLPPAVSQLLAELRRLQTGALAVESLVNAVHAKNMDAALAASATVSRQLFGAELDLTAVLQTPATEAAGALDGLAKLLGFAVVGTPQWPTDDEADTADMPDLPDVLPAEGTILKRIADAWTSVGEIDTQLAKAQSEFDDHKSDLPLNLQEAAQGVLKDTTTLDSIIKTQIGSIYRHTVHLGRGLQAVQRSLDDIKAQSIGDGTGDTLNPAKLLQRLEAARAVVEIALDGLEAALKEIAAAFSNYLSKPNNQAALAGGFAATLIASTDIADAVKKLEAALQSAQSKVADCLTVVVSLSLKLLSKGSLLATAGISEVSKIVAALPEILNPERNSVVAALTKLTSTLPVNLREDFDAGGSPETIEKLLVLPVKTGEGTSVQQFFMGGGASTEFDTIRDGLRNAEITAVNAYRSLLDRASALPAALRDKAFNLIKPALEPLATGYAAILEARNKVLKDPSLAEGLATGLVVQALTVPKLEGFACDGEGCDRLQQEADWISDAANATDFGQTEVRKQLGAFLDGWLGGQAAPLLIIRNLKDLVVKATSGDILSMIDVAALRDEIEDTLANLVPLRTTLAYDLNLATGSYGAGQSQGKIFSLMNGSRFDVAVRVNIDLLGKDPVKFRADGKLGAFEVNLLGGIFEAVALKFHGASFLIEDGGKPSFDVNYNTFEIGKELEFAQQLQSFLSPSGSGFYLQPLDGLPGIEAGYGINLGTIQLGGISFSNVSLNVAALLPFTDSEALFRASLARRLAPFTISVPPFGGAGYFAITASAKKIVGFEASFEFGGSADFSFGPLVAYGRIMSGFYIRTQELASGHRVTELSGTFFAGGAASIWIFNFYASLYVKLGMAEGGAMEGEAIFSFAFSMGIVDYDYSVRAASSQPAMGSGGGGGSSQSGALESPTRFAGISADGIDRSIITGATGATITPDEYGFVTGVKVTTVCQGKDTSKYFDYFDIALLEQAS